MHYYSTNRKSPEVDPIRGRKGSQRASASNGVNFKTALLLGLAPDGGLYMPRQLPQVYKVNKVFKVHKVLKEFIDIPEKDLKKLAKNAFNFPVPLVKLDENLYILELFHGPTLSFKDFGARFMARIMSYFANEKRKAKGEKLKIIVATSGDTGSAVAAGFYNVPNIEVYILYPSGKVSGLQEKQLTTFGGNIIAIEVKGDFDDCQRLAKLALGDTELRKKINLSSANSINIGRLLPQMYYYFLGWKQFLAQQHHTNKLEFVRMTFVVPSGNFGNLTAGLFAKKLGLPVKKFIAAVNINSGVPEYLQSGKLKTKKAKLTLSNAMDVGNPSNWARVLDLYRAPNPNNPNSHPNDTNLKKLRNDLEAITVTDAETKKTIRDIYKKYDYIIDPHTAVGVAAALKSKAAGPKIVLATAHPAKFKEIVEDAIGKKIKFPPSLAAVQKKKKQSIVIEPTKEALYKILFSGGSKSSTVF